MQHHGDHGVQNNCEGDTPRKHNPVNTKSLGPTCHQQRSSSPGTRCQAHVGQLAHSFGHRSPQCSAAGLRHIRHECPLSKQNHNKQWLVLASSAKKHECVQASFVGLQAPLVGHRDIGIQPQDSNCQASMKSCIDKAPLCPIPAGSQVGHFDLGFGANPAADIETLQNSFQLPQGKKSFLSTEIGG